jgi:hypothetical protein
MPAIKKKLVLGIYRGGEVLPDIEVFKYHANAIF